MNLGSLDPRDFSVPLIRGVGNLVIGGAGKTPHVEYLIRLLKPYIDVGTLVWLQSKTRIQICVSTGQCRSSWG